MNTFYLCLVDEFEKFFLLKSVLKVNIYLNPLHIFFILTKAGIRKLAIPDRYRDTFIVCICLVSICHHSFLSFGLISPFNIVNEYKEPVRL